MSEGAQFSFVSITVAVVILGAIGACLYGCERANRSYYDMARDCTSKGGSFVPTGNGSYSAICIGRAAQ